VSDALFRNTQAAEPVEVTRLSSTESRPDFSVVMLTRNHLELTRVAVETLLEAARGERLEFVFVANGSTDGTLRYFHQVARRTPTTVVQCDPDEHFIYARNCNRGARVAVGRYLLLANNDIRAGRFVFHAPETGPPGGGRGRRDHQPHGGQRTARTPGGRPADSVSLLEASDGLLLVPATGGF